MEDIFSKLHSLNGVLGSAVFSIDGQVVMEKMHPDQPSIDYSVIAGHTEEISFLLDSLSDNGGPEILLQGSAVQAYVRKEGSFFIMVLMELAANITTIAVALNSAVVKARAALADYDGASMAPSRSSSGGRSPSSGKVRRDSGPAGAPGVGPVRKKGSVSAIGDWAAGPPPADAVGIKFVNHIYYVCELFMGSSAREVLVREMKALGVSPSTLNVRTVQDLIDRLGQYLEGSPARKEFRDKVLGDQ